MALMIGLAACSDDSSTNNKEDSNESLPSSFESNSVFLRLGFVDPSTVVKGTVTNLSNGKVYKTVKIGHLNWTAENVPVDEACPESWHSARIEEWEILFENVGGQEEALNKLKSTTGWATGNGTDDYGFSLLPTGAIEHTHRFSIDFCISVSDQNDDGSFHEVGADSLALIGAGSNEDGLCTTDYVFFDSTVSFVVPDRYYTPTGKRCIEDYYPRSSEKIDGDKITYGTVADQRDGRVLKTGTIGNLTWMLDNMVNAYAEEFNFYWDEAKEACPEGWRLPTVAEWDYLLGYSGAACLPSDTNRCIIVMDDSVLNIKPGDNYFALDEVEPGVASYSFYDVGYEKNIGYTKAGIRCVKD